MIDKEGNIVPRSFELNKKFRSKLKWMRKNVALIAIILPLIISLCRVIVEFTYYLMERGYYSFFSIPPELMLPYNKSKIYQDIVILGIVFIYALYCFFTVRMLLKKGNYLWKIMSAVIIPVVISCIYAYVSVGYSKFFFLAIGICMFFHIVMTWAIGYCMPRGIFGNRVVMRERDAEKEKEKRKEKEKEKEKEKRRGKGKGKGKEKDEGWKSIDYKVPGVVMVTLGIAVLFFNAYITNRDKASEKCQFGIVCIEGEEYAVIDENEEKLILEKCQDKGSTLIIKKNTYLKIDNNVMICFKLFKEVKLEDQKRGILK